LLIEIEPPSNPGGVVSLSHDVSRDSIIPRISFTWEWRVCTRGDYDSVVVPELEGVHVGNYARMNIRYAIAFDVAL
jgi:hypothetical protein